MSHTHTQSLYYTRCAIYLIPFKMACISFILVIDYRGLKLLCFCFCDILWSRLRFIWCWIKNETLSYIAAPTVKYSPRWGDSRCRRLPSNNAWWKAEVRWIIKSILDDSESVTVGVGNLEEKTRLGYVRKSYWSMILVIYFEICDYVICLSKNKIQQAAKLLVDCILFGNMIWRAELLGRLSQINIRVLI